MNEYNSQAFDREIKKTKKTHNKPCKVITTSRQWNCNASGSYPIDNYSSNQIYEAIDEYKNNCNYYY